MKKNLFFVTIIFLFTYHTVDAQIIQDDYTKDYMKRFNYVDPTDYLERGDYKIKPWTDAYEATQDSIVLITNQLIEIAVDSTKSRYDRRSGIFLIGKIRTDKALQFLVDNLSYFLPKDGPKSDGGYRLEKPCKYILNKEKDWAVIPILLKQLEKKKEKQELKDYAELMIGICGRKMAISIIDGMGVDFYSPPDFRKNVFQLKKYLEE